MGGGPVSGRQMGGVYNMYPWQQLMGLMAGGGRLADGQAMPGWGGMPQMMGMMPVWQGGCSSPGCWGHRGGTVYRPTFDFLMASSHTSTPVEPQFTGDETFSLHELGIDIREADTAVPAEEVGRGRAAPKKKKNKGKSKVVGESSQPAVDDTTTRRKWTDDENVALSKAWVSVCDDPLVANNQRIVNMWAKIRADYRRNCPHGKDYTGEECRKGWERIRAAVGRFSGLYTNGLRMQTSGQTEEDCRRIAEIDFPLPRIYK